MVVRHDVENIGPTAHLAIFHVRLIAPCAEVNKCSAWFTAKSAMVLGSCLHTKVSVSNVVLSVVVLPVWFNGRGLADEIPAVEQTNLQST